MKPQLSVIICTRNRRHDIKRCLDSLFLQSYRNFEIIVVDGHSRDGTKRLVSSYKSDIKMKFVEQSGKGLSNARNDGIKMSSGRIIAFIDDDVIVHKDWVKNILKNFKKNPKIGYISGPVRTEPSNIYEEWQGGKFDMAKNLKSRYAHGCNMAYRQSILLDNLFDEQFEFGADETELQFRLNIKGIKCRHFNDMNVTHNHRYKNIFDVAKQYNNYSKGTVKFYSKYNIGLLKIGDLSNLTILFMFFWITVFYISNTTTFSTIFSVIFLILFLFSFRNFYKSNSFRKVGIRKKIIFTTLDILFSVYMSILIVKNRINMKI